jgi:hypothetical protein
MARTVAITVAVLAAIGVGLAWLLASYASNGHGRWLLEGVRKCD